MISFLEEVKKMTEKETELSVRDRWEAIGFLQGLEDENLKNVMSDWFESTAQYLMNNNEKVTELTKDKTLTKDELETVVFAEIRKICCTIAYLFSLKDNEFFIKELVEHWEKNKEFLNDETIKCDKEAELCNAFVATKLNLSKFIKAITKKEMD